MKGGDSDAASDNEMPGNSSGACAPDPDGVYAEPALMASPIPAAQPSDSAPATAATAESSPWVSRAVVLTALNDMMQVPPEAWSSCSIDELHQALRVCRDAGRLHIVNPFFQDLIRRATECEQFPLAPDTPPTGAHPGAATSRPMPVQPALAWITSVQDTLEDLCKRVRACEDTLGTSPSTSFSSRSVLGRLDQFDLLFGG